MTHSPEPPLITILGATASGKTKLAVALAKAFQGEIISADSRQVYRYMDIGTGKDLEEYGEVPYHLIDMIHPENEYSLFNFSLDFCNAFNHISSKQHLPLLVGGTGMYLDAVLSRYKLTIANIDENTRLELEKKSDDALVAYLRDLKPELHNTTDIQDRTRILKAIEIALSENNALDTGEQEFVAWPTVRPLILGIKIERHQLKERIKLRLKNRFEQNMIDEVEMLIRKGISFDRLDKFGLEYRYIARYLNGQLKFNDMFQKLNSEIDRFSKQQEKWFRNLEKKQHKIIWLDADEYIEKRAKSIIEEFIYARG